MRAKPFCTGWVRGHSWDPFCQQSPGSQLMFSTNRYRIIFPQSLLIRTFLLFPMVDQQEFLQSSSCQNLYSGAFGRSKTASSMRITSDSAISVAHISLQPWCVTIQLVSGKLTFSNGWGVFCIGCMVLSAAFWFFQHLRWTTWHEVLNLCCLGKSCLLWNLESLLKIAHAWVCLTKSASWFSLYPEKHEACHFLLCKTDTSYCRDKEQFLTGRGETLGQAVTQYH